MPLSPRQRLLAAAAVPLLIVMAACADEPSGPPTPDGFPLPGDAELAPDDGDLLRWTTPSPGATVYRFYTEALPAAGFDSLELAPGGSVASIRFTDRDGVRWQLDLRAVAGPQDGTAITLGPPRP